MINIEPIYENIIMVIDENYSPDRIKIIESLFQSLSLTILDYEIRILRSDSILGEYVDVYPYNLDEDFFTTLKKFEEMEKETESELKFSMKILAVMKKENQYD